jgi:membrane-associated phospholipid phosphatase/tRNA A-37 threonylcarbamoyl transferase component Bud32
VTTDLASAAPVEKRRRRRPTGAAPPLPKTIGRTGRLWLAALGLFTIWMIVLIASRSARLFTERIDSEVLQLLAGMRTGWLTDAMRAVDRIATGWILTIVSLALLVLAMVFRRWRHLFTFIGIAFATRLIGSLLYYAFTRPRPLGVTTIGRWASFAFPSPPIGILAMVLLGITYMLVVPGRPRRLAKYAVGVALAVFAFARLYLAVDHPTDVLVGLALGVTIPLFGFRLFTPNEIAPVRYRRGKTAHLDVSGARGEAIRRAVRDQLGLVVLEAKPIGLEGSGGSTPLRLRVAGDPDDTYVFAKLYAMNHVRADRWYKLGREILYGRLEDEARFQTVRRFVEYEDYTFRLLEDAGIPTAESHGIVEITPGREYMLVIGFIEGAQELGDADVDDDVIDEGLRLIRCLWDAGLAHRDIKPANILVRDGKVFLIDAFFVQVRPSPWRQAVDLGNMMLALAVRSEPERVYNRALQFFTPDEIAEAFAATRGVASPTQLRTMMKRDGRDLLAQFRALAPPRKTISLQRWSFHRVFLAVVVALVLLVSVNWIVGMFLPTYELDISQAPDCETSNLTVLMAQSVPEATMVPCVATYPAGWSLGDVRVRNDRALFWLNSDIAGDHAVEATLQPEDRCDVSAATEVPSDEVGTQRYESLRGLPPALESTRYYLFPGGCVTYRFDFDADATSSQFFDADQALGFLPRSTLAEEVEDLTELPLCGADAECPGGTGR